MKQCFVCKETKKIDDFYRHSQMSDGHLNKCKECTKKQAIKNRLTRVEYYRNYDKKRGSRTTAEETQRYRENNPRKYAAHIAVGNATKAGILIKIPCENCGKDDNSIHAHHDDYLKQLDVRWLCAVCHKKWHKENGPGKNG